MSPATVTKKMLLLAPWLLYVNLGYGLRIEGYIYKDEWEAGER